MLNSIYIYEPNKGAPVFFAVAFFISAVGHLWQCYRHKAWRLMGLQLLGALMFTVGYALREYGAFHHGFSTLEINIYIAATCLVYMAPPLLELGNYHVLGHIFYYIPYKAPMAPSSVLTTFGLLSGLVEALNAIGVSYLASPNVSASKKDVGDKLMKAGLILQIVVIALFFALATAFHVNCRRAGLNVRKVTTPLRVLYVSTVLILVRTVYRTVEHFLSAKIASATLDWSELSPVAKYEWYFYVFESAVMLLNSWLWNVWFAGRYLPQNVSVYLERDGVNEAVAPAGANSSGRGWLMQVLDPFGWMDSGKSRQSHQQLQQQQQQQHEYGMPGRQYTPVQQHGDGPMQSQNQQSAAGGRSLFMKLMDPFGWLDSSKHQRNVMSPGKEQMRGSAQSSPDRAYEWA